MSRERNRQSAKLNRDRKKEETRELQDTVQYLKRKNQSLQNELSLRPSFLANEQRLMLSFEKRFSSQIVSVLEQLRVRAGSDSSAFYVINAASHFFPIVCASPGFVELTGYPLHEVVGQNCGFLSGLQTSRNEVTGHIYRNLIILKTNFTILRMILLARAFESGSSAGTRHLIHLVELPPRWDDVLEQHPPCQFTYNQRKWRGSSLLDCGATHGGI